MKILFRSLLVLAAGAGSLATARAQTFPNSGLDTWVTRNSTEVPDNWRTTDDVIEDSLGFRFPTNTVVKTTVVRAASGPFAAQLQTQTIQGLQAPGVIILGNSTRRRAGVPGGLPFTARPATLVFYYQLTGPQAVADAPFVLVQLTRRVGNQTQVVANASYVFTAAAASYARIDLRLNYRSALTPDSVSLAFSSGRTRAAITPGTILRIDDISFTGTAAATRDAALNAALSASPNPSPDGRFVLSAAAEPALLSAPLVVLDATGRVVRREAAPRGAGAATRPLDLSALPAGVYTVQLFTAAGLVTRKLVR